MKKGLIIFLKRLYHYIYIFIFIIKHPLAYFTKKVRLGKNVLIKNCKFNLKTKKYKIIIGDNTRLINCNIYLYGDNNSLIIKNNCLINNCTLYLKDFFSEISIESLFTIESGSINSMGGCVIKIGKDCMFSGNVDLRNGDSHEIYNKDKELLNKDKNIFIGNHVWICANVTILKGSSILDNCIIGNSSVINKKLTSPNAIYAGIPARLIKKDIYWLR